MKQHMNDESTTTNHIRQRKQNTDPLRCIYFSTRSSEISSSVNSLFTNKFTHHKWVCTEWTPLVFALAARKYSMLTNRVRLRVLNLGQNCQLQIPHTHWNRNPANSRDSQGQMSTNTSYNKPTSGFLTSKTGHIWVWLFDSIILEVLAAILLSTSPEFPQI